MPDSEVHWVAPKPDAPLVMLVRVSPVKPDHCIHGQAQCARCRHWVWLGHSTVELVKSGEAVPMCINCAHELADEGTVSRSDLVGHIQDHQRKDGPHE